MLFRLLGLLLRMTGIGVLVLFLRIVKLRYALLWLDLSTKNAGIEKTLEMLHSFLFQFYNFSLASLGEIGRSWCAMWMLWIKCESEKAWMVFVCNTLCTLSHVCLLELREKCFVARRHRNFSTQTYFPFQALLFSILLSRRLHNVLHLLFIWCH